jgi:purine-binding chemotaxis protein CheW
MVKQPEGLSPLLASPPTNSSLSGKYLIFQLACQEFGIPILYAREVIGALEITPIPQLPPHVKGLINLRGQVIPVIDLRLKFGLQPPEAANQSCVILVYIVRFGKPVPVGFLVDGVPRVAAFGPENLQQIPDFGEDVDTEFLIGVAKAGQKVMPLLDIQKVLTAHDLHGLAALVERDTPIQ